MGHLKILTIGPSTFNPVNPDYPGTLVDYGGELRPLGDHGVELDSNFWSAPVAVPHLSKFEYLKLYYNNILSGGRTSCKLRATPFDGSLGYHLIGDVVAPSDSTGTGSVVDDSLLESLIRVNNDVHTYRVIVCLSTLYDHLRGVEIGYWD